MVEEWLRVGGGHTFAEGRRGHCRPASDERSNRLGNSTTATRKITYIPRRKACSIPIAELGRSPFSGLMRSHGWLSGLGRWGRLRRALVPCIFSADDPTYGNGPSEQMVDLPGEMVRAAGGKCLYLGWVIARFGKRLRSPARAGPARATASPESTIRTCLGSNPAIACDTNG